MSEENLGPPYAARPPSKPRPKDSELVLSETGRAREASNELVRRYLHEDKTSLVAELQKSSPVELIDLAIGLKLSVLGHDYGNDDYEETVANTLYEFCLRLASSKSTQ